MGAGHQSKERHDGIGILMAEGQRFYASAIRLNLLRDPATVLASPSMSPTASEAKPGRAMSDRKCRVSPHSIDCARGIVHHCRPFSLLGLLLIPLLVALGNLISWDPSWATNLSPALVADPVLSHKVSFDEWPGSGRVFVV